jgi:hypothetical protein
MAWRRRLRTRPLLGKSLFRSVSASERTHGLFFQPLDLMLEHLLVREEFAAFSVVHL